MISAIKAVAGWNLKPLLVAGFCAAALSGCGGTAEKFISAGQEPIEISPETFAPPVQCPPMELKSNTYLIRKFVRGQEDNREALLYQATVEDWANTCTALPDGRRQMKLGFSGEVTSGPAWKGGEVTLPLRVAIVPGGEGVKPLASDLLTIPVTLGADSPSESWTLIENKFVIDANQSVKVVFGFDERGR
ncbi:hypothetical protein FMN50_05180 [Rhodobacterales bacterium]|nr:hypothetical protein FMN50_05180 [Rhodobacterales bacterium]